MDIVRTTGGAKVGLGTPTALGETPQAGVSTCVGGDCGSINDAVVKKVEPRGACGVPGLVQVAASYSPTLLAQYHRRWRA